MKRLALLLALVSLPLLAQEPAKKSIPACFAPDTMAVLRIDAAQLMEQPLFQEVLTLKVGDIQTFFQNIRNATGVDLGAIKQVWIGVQKKDHVAMVIKGNFDMQAIQNLMLNIGTAQVVQRPGVPFAVSLPEDNKPGQFNLAALLDAETIVFGKPELADAFLAAYLGNGNGLPAASAARANALLESKALVTGVLLNLPAEETRKNPWMTLFTYAEIEASLTDPDVVLKVALGLRKPEMREPLAKAVEGIRDTYKLLDEDLRRLGPIPSMLLEGATLQPDAERLVVQVSIPQEVAERLIRQKMGMP